LAGNRHDVSSQVVSSAGEGEIALNGEYLFRVNSYSFKSGSIIISLPKELYIIFLGAVFLNLFLFSKNLLNTL